MLQFKSEAIAEPLYRRKGDFGQQQGIVCPKISFVVGALFVLISSRLEMLTVRPGRSAKRKHMFL